MRNFSKDERRKITFKKEKKKNKKQTPLMDRAYN